jgi:predicted component of type VI protein secretion system
MEAEAAAAAVKLSMKALEQRYRSSLAEVKDAVYCDSSQQTIRYDHYSYRFLSIFFMDAVICSQQSE